MLTVIFGAGASYDSNPSNRPGSNDDDYRPPLANDLFADRKFFRQTLLRFPQMHPLVPRLRFLQGGSSIEQVLERYRDESTSPTNPDPLRSQQLAAVRFYIQTVIALCSHEWLGQIGGSNNYLTLIDDIRHHGN